jgi:hypothetical protein
LYPPSDAIVHFWGCVLMSWLILDSWSYTSFWYIWVFFR